jgi:hypothetical protein
MLAKKVKPYDERVILYVKQFTTDEMIFILQRRVKKQAVLKFITLL